MATTRTPASYMSAIDPLNFTISVYYYGPRLLIGGVLRTPPAVVTDTLPAGFRGRRYPRN